MGETDRTTSLSPTSRAIEQNKPVTFGWARILASFDRIMESIKSEDRSPNLGDVLSEYGGAKHPLSTTVDGDTLKTGFSDIGQNDVLTVPIYEDKISKFRYSFLNLPIEYLHHDDHINPRAIGKNLKKILEEFHRKLPQLHIALGWIDTSLSNASKVSIFDGQHKAAAQILLGVRCLPVRVFINPNTDILLTANTHAGTTLRQVAFDKSVQRSLVAHCWQTGWIVTDVNAAKTRTTKASQNAISQITSRAKAEK